MVEQGRPAADSRRRGLRDRDPDGGSDARWITVEEVTTGVSSVVLDTNVFVAAGFNPASASANLLHAVRDGRLRMPWTDSTRREIERILRQIPPLRTHTVAELFRPVGRVTAAIERGRFDDIPDPDDRKFAALAHAAGAVLVSSDKHLLGYRGAMELTVTTPGAFWAGFAAHHHDGRT